MVVTSATQNDNFVILTGILVNKDKNADNADIKRPVLDFEILFHSEDGPCLERIGALLPGGAIARKLPGLTIGSIYFVGGYLRCDPQYGLYVEVNRILKISDERRGGEPLAVRRTKLMEMEMIPNVAVITGKVADSQYGLLQVEVERETLTKGDLTKSDLITVDALNTLEPELGEMVVCRGQICSGSLFADSIMVIRPDAREVQA